MNWKPYTKYLNLKKAYVQRIDLLRSFNYALRELMRKRIERESCAHRVVTEAIEKARRESKLKTETK